MTSLINIRGNYFYDEEDLAIFYGVKNIADIDGSLYVRKFDNFSKNDEFGGDHLGRKERK